MRVRLSEDVFVYPRDGGQDFLRALQTRVWFFFLQSRSIVANCVERSGAGRVKQLQASNWFVVNFSPVTAINIPVLITPTDV